MKYLSVSLLVAMLVTAVGSAHAQEANSTSVSPVPSQSGSLMTQPASVDQRQRQSGQVRQPLNTEQLNAISGSISGKPPKKPREPSIIPDGIIPENLLPTWNPKPVEPLEDFKVPPLDGGLKVPIR